MRCRRRRSASGRRTCRCRGRRGRRDRRPSDRAGPRGTPWSRRAGARARGALPRRRRLRRRSAEPASGSRKPRDSLPIATSTAAYRASSARSTGTAKTSYSLRSSIVRSARPGVAATNSVVSPSSRSRRISATQSGTRPCISTVGWQRTWRAAAIRASSARGHSAARVVVEAELGRDASPADETRLRRASPGPPKSIGRRRRLSFACARSASS